MTTKDPSYRGDNRQRYVQDDNSPWEKHLADWPESLCMSWQHPPSLCIRERLKKFHWRSRFLPHQSVAVDTAESDRDRCAECLQYHSLAEALPSYQSTSTKEKAEMQSGWVKCVVENESVWCNAHLCNSHNQESPINQIGSLIFAANNGDIMFTWHHVHLICLSCGVVFCVVFVVRGDGLFELGWRHARLPLAEPECKFKIRMRAPRLGAVTGLYQGVRYSRTWYCTVQRSWHSTKDTLTITMCTVREPDRCRAVPGTVIYNATRCVCDSSIVRMQHGTSCSGDDFRSIGTSLVGATAIGFFWWLVGLLRFKV